MGERSEGRSHSATEIASKVKRLYEARSAIVHGRRKKRSKIASEPADASNADERLAASDLLRFVLNALLTNPEYQDPIKIDEGLLLRGDEFMVAKEDSTGDQQRLRQTASRMGGAQRYHQLLLTPGWVSRRAQPIQHAGARPIRLSGSLGRNAALPVASPPPELWAASSCQGRRIPYSRTHRARNSSPPIHAHWSRLARNPMFGSQPPARWCVTPA
jgi:hypothetical protein